MNSIIGILRSSDADSAVGGELARIGHPCRLSAIYYEMHINGPMPLIDMIVEC
jgi:hypothetical protein